MLPDSLAVASSSFAHGVLAGLFLGIVFGGILVLSLGAVLMAGRADALTEPLTESAGNGNTNPLSLDPTAQPPPCLRGLPVWAIRFTQPLTHLERAEHAHDN